MNFGMKEALEPLVRLVTNVHLELQRTNMLLEQLLRQRGEPLLPHLEPIEVTGDTTVEEIGDVARQAVRAVRKRKT